MNKKEKITYIVIVLLMGLAAIVLSEYFNRDTYVDQTEDIVQAVDDRDEVERQVDDIESFKRLLDQTRQQIDEYTVLEYELEQNLVVVRLDLVELKEQEESIMGDIRAFTEGLLAKK
jgi:hypothetical protein